MKEVPALIIDDDIWMQRILSKIVEGFGFTPYIAQNGFEGVALAVEKRPKIIFLDIMMPELSGHLTLKILKQIRLTKDVPVVMISALSDTENLGIAVKIGAAGFICKPFTRATILDKLRNILGSDFLSNIGKKSYKEDEVEHEYEESPQIMTENISDADIYSSPSPVFQELKEDFPKPERSSKEASKKYQDESSKRQIDAIKELLLKEKR